MAITKNQYPPQPISLYEAERALSFISPKDRDTWVRMGAAMKSEFGEDAKSSWIRWSQGDDSFRNKDANDVWKSLRAGHINIGTLIHEAKLNGYIPERNSKAAQLSQQEIRERELQRQRAAQEAEAQRQAEAVAAKATAQALYAKGKRPDPKHPYLINKGIDDPDSLARIRQLGKNLLIPTYQNKEIVGVQKINPDGGKYFGKGEQLSGSSLFIGKWEQAKKDGLLMAEGFATAASLHKATGQPVLITFNAYNLIKMADRIKEQNLPSITLCADNDSHKKGTGLIYAQQAAQILGEQAKVVVPEFTQDDIQQYQAIHGQDTYPTDFNDLHALRGIDALKTFFKEKNMEKEQQTPAQGQQVTNTPAQASQRELTSIKVEFAESAKDHNGKTFNDAQQLQDWFKSIYDEQRQLNTQGYSKVFLVLEDNQNTQHKVRIDVGRDDYDPYIETPQERLSSYKELKGLNMSNFVRSQEREVEENSINFDYEQSRVKVLAQYNQSQVTQEETTFKATTQTQKNEKEFEASTEKVTEQQPQDVAEQSMPKEVEEYLASRYTLDHHYVPRPPQSLAERYFASDEYYFDTQTQTSIFLDKGDKLSSARSDRQTIADMLEVAKAKGWDNITLKGTNEFKRQAFLEAESQGISTTGYTPTKEDQALLKHLINMRALNSVEKAPEPERVQPQEHQPAQESKQEVEVAPEAQTIEQINLTPDGERKFEAFIQSHLKEEQDINRVRDDMIETLENQQLKQEPMQYTLHWSQTKSGLNETIEFNQHDIDIGNIEEVDFLKKEESLSAQADREASALVANNEIPTVGQINESWVADTQEFVSTQEIGGAEIDPDVLAAANRLRDAGKNLTQSDRGKLAAHIQVASNITKHLQGDFKAHAVRNLEENLAKSMNGDKLIIKDPLKPQQSTQQSQEQTREERSKSIDLSR